MPSYIAEEQRGTEARILNVLFPTILQHLQLAHQAANQLGAPPVPMAPPFAPPFMQQPIGPLMEQRGTYFPAQLATDRSFMDVISVLMPAIQAVVPPLVEQLLQFGPAKSDIDQSEEDRFLQFVPQLISTLAPIVIQVLPGLLQSLGGQRADTPVRVTDRELNTRFFGPLLQALLPAVISHLPDLLAIVHGDQRSPIRYDRAPGRGAFQLIRIGRNDLASRHRLRDGDVVYLTETPAPAGTTEVRLTVAPHVTWWKGLEIVDDADSRIAFIESDGTDSVSFDSRSVQTGGGIVFWKAKMWGVHTPMYIIPTGDLTPDGKCFNLHWATD